MDVVLLGADARRPRQNPPTNSMHAADPHLQIGSVPSRGMSRHRTDACLHSPPLGRQHARAVLLDAILTHDVGQVEPRWLSLPW